MQDKLVTTLQTQSHQACTPDSAQAGSLRNFEHTHIDEDCQGISGHHENELFFNCKFNKVNGLTLKNCDLNNSTFNTESINDALGLTVTLDCHSFSNVTLSPLMFDLLLMLLTKTKGNDAKRRALIDVVGKEEFFKLLRQTKTLE